MVIKMLKVLPIQTKKEQEELCALCNVKYDADLLAYSATVDDKPAGIAQFTMNADGGSIRDIRCVSGTYDFEVLFVLGRATLNFIDLTGVHKAYFDGEIADEAEERMIKAIGFTKQENGRYFVDLTDFFTSPCQHDKK